MKKKAIGELSGIIENHATGGCFRENYSLIPDITFR